MYKYYTLGPMGGPDIGRIEKVIDETYIVGLNVDTPTSWEHG